MKFRATIDFDTNTGDYEIKFNNLDQPGEPMDLLDIQEGMALVVKDFYIKLDKEDDLPEGFYEIQN